MGFKVIVIAGEPATGKSTLVKKAFEPEKMPNSFEFGLLRGHTDNQIFVAGLYRGELFDGTDKLSMAVQPHALSFVNQCATHGREGALIAEGDRLSNAKFLEALRVQAVAVHLVMLRAPQEVLDERHVQRGDVQNERWLSSRRTKAQNLCEAARALPHVTLHEWVNETLHSCGVHASALRAIATS